MTNKEQAAKQLTDHHFAIEPDLHFIFRIVNDNEASPNEPIKLLEVNAATVASGSVEVFNFGPSKEIPFPVQIAEVTPDEYERFKSNPNVFPEGWDISRGSRIDRPTGTK